MPGLRKFTSHVQLISKLFKDVNQENKRANQKRGHHRLQEIAAPTQKSREGQSCLAGQMTANLIWSRMISLFLEKGLQG